MLYTVMVGHCGHCGPYHDLSSQWSRWRCEVEVRCKGIVYFIKCDGWSLWSLPWSWFPLE